jgi:hypothetical protein
MPPQKQRKVAVMGFRAVGALYTHWAAFDDQNNLFTQAWLSLEFSKDLCFLYLTSQVFVS